MNNKWPGTTQPYSLATYSSLLEALYGGFGETPLWAGFLGQLRAELDANICFLILRNPARDDPGLLLSDGLPRVSYDPTHNIYSDELYALDPFVNLPPGEVFALEEFLPGDARQHSEFYQRCLQPFDIEYILGADLHLDDGMRASLRVTRAPALGSFTAQDKAGVQLLLPHLKRSIQYYVTLQSVEFERGLLDRTVSQLALGTVLLDDRRRILHTNAAADQVLAQGAGLRRQDDALVLDNTGEAKALRELLGSALAAHASGEPHLVQAMSVTRKEKHLPLNLVVRPLPVTAYLEGQPHPAVVVFLSDPEGSARTSGDVLGQLYGLTPAEVRLSLLLADGQSVEEASESLGISRYTARAHLRAIFSKTGLTQQTKLVSLVLKSIAAVTGADEREK